MHRSKCIRRGPSWRLLADSDTQSLSQSWEWFEHLSEHMWTCSSCQRMCVCVCKSVFHGLKLSACNYSDTVHVSFLPQECVENWITGLDEGKHDPDDHLFLWDVALAFYCNRVISWVTTVSGLETTKGNGAHCQTDPLWRSGSDLPGSFLTSTRGDKWVWISERWLPTEQRPFNRQLHSTKTYPQQCDRKLFSINSSNSVTVLESTGMMMI